MASEALPVSEVFEAPISAPEALPAPAPPTVVIIADCPTFNSLRVIGNESVSVRSVASVDAAINLQN